MANEVHEVHYEVAGEIVRGHLHIPAALSKRVPGVLIIPGFADTAVGPHNMHVLMARALCQAGFVVMRFDYRGQGESDGDFKNFTAQSGLDDARHALKLLGTQAQVDPATLGIVGFSLGGTLAALLASYHSAVQSLVLLAPVAYPQQVFRAFFTEEQLAQGEQQGWIDWLGWPVGRHYLPKLAELEPLGAIEQTKAAALVIQGSTDSEVPLENGQAFAARGAKLHVLEGGDHQFGLVVLQDEAIRLACDWFRMHLLGEER